MEWRDIKGFSGYMVSDEGQVYSMKSNRLLTASKHVGDYRVVSLKGNKKNHTLLVHRLVYEAFVGSIPKGMQVNHKDENKSNNRLDNLELLTPKENSNYGTRNQRIVESNRQWRKARRKRFGRPVLQYNRDGVLIRKWEAIAEAEEQGFCKTGIGRCCRGDMKTYKGCRWEYADSIC